MNRFGYTLLWNGTACFKVSPRTFAFLPCEPYTREKMTAWLDYAEDEYERERIQWLIDNFDPNLIEGIF